MKSRFNALIQNKWLSYGLIALGGVFILGLIFSAGFVAGRWSAMPINSLGRNNTLKSGHGAIGVIKTIEGQRIVVLSRDGKQETIVVSNNTQFDKNFQKIYFTDLKINDRIVVIGSPNVEGGINARLIGLVDPGTFRFLPRFPTSPGVAK